MATRESRMRRIDRILDQNRKLSQPPGIRVLAGLVLAALPLIYVATAMRPASAQARVPASQVCGGNPAWAAWLSEDVVYIITNEERRAFEQLGTEGQCAKFAEQFWLRRDPSPGSPLNGFKEEHYRRIAYANEHFAATQIPGWKTDRARVYITVGPPDEIESHPAGRSGTAAMYPFEQWLYHHTNSLGDDVVFDFIDQTHTNEYRLSFMGGPAERTIQEGKGDDRTVLFGPVDGLSVQVNPNRTLLITSPVRGILLSESPSKRTSIPVSGTIVDHNGSAVQVFQDTTQASIYGKWIDTPLSAGQYVLHIDAGGDRRTITFEVK